MDRRIQMLLFLNMEDIFDCESLTLVWLYTTFIPVPDHHLIKKLLLKLGFFKENGMTADESPPDQNSLDILSFVSGTV